MNHVLIILIAICISTSAYSQQDTVLIKYKKSWKDNLFVTDTVFFPSSMYRHMLFGTTILPATNNQMYARSYGLYFDQVAKSECLQSGEEVYRSKDKINSIASTDSTLVVDLSVYDNCCYDFLCDVAIDSMGTVNIIYYGYGTNCACECCFGLTYRFSLAKDLSYPALKAVMLNGRRETMKKID